MRLHVILGLADNKPSSPISVVYAGRSGVESRQAMDNSPCPRFYVLQNPLGYSKNNRHAAANAAKAPAPEEPTDIDGILAANEQLQATVEKLEAELKLMSEGFESLVLEKKKLAEALNAAGSPEPTASPEESPPPADQQNSDQQEEQSPKPPSKETTPAKAGKNASAKPPTPGGKK